MKKIVILKILFPTILLFFWAVTVNTTIDDFFMPGTQPNDSRTYDSPSNCANCHGGINNNTDQSFEPTFGWQGSMMSQAMRDPLYLASLAIANQDADFAGDLCLRCHTPSGWLSGRSEPTDGTALTINDMEGVDCHFCHELISPNSSNPDDLIILNALDAEGNKPPQSGNGMFVVENDNKKRHGPFNDADPKSHAVVYDSFYSESDYCATCHDVSNPAFTLNTATGNYDLNALGVKSTTFNTYEMFPVERTYSEWKMSAYNTLSGVSGTSFGGNKSSVATCQDCHMKDVTGYGCNKNNILLRNDLPQHDMTGGNTFIPLLIKQLYASDQNVNSDALDNGILRARNMLKNAATMDVSVEQEIDGYEVSVKITNETGHKLPSGYPEGRRMWINLIAYDADNSIIYESGAYNEETAELSKYDTYGNPSKIYEAKLGMSSNPGVESFHFALNNVILKDNRIPPRGFKNVNFKKIQAAPIAYSYEDDEYYDETEYSVPIETHHISVKLLYQTVSKEYVEFLRDENETNDSGQILYDLWVANDKSKPEIMNENESINVTLAIHELEQIFSNKLSLFPNPATNEVNLSYTLKNSGHLTIEVFDANGRKIETLFNDYQSLQQNKIKWKTSQLSSGVYIVKFKSGNKSASTRIIIK